MKTKSKGIFRRISVYALSVCLAFSAFALLSGIIGAGRKNLPSTVFANSSTPVGDHVQEHLPWAETAQVLFMNNSWANNFDFAGGIDTMVNTPARIDGNGEYVVSVANEDGFGAFLTLGIALVNGATTYPNSRTRLASVKTYTDMNMTAGEEELVLAAQLVDDIGGKMYTAQIATSNTNNRSRVWNEAWGSGNNMRRAAYIRDGRLPLEFDAAKFGGNTGGITFVSNVKAIKITFYFEHNTTANLATNNVNEARATALQDAYDLRKDVEKGGYSDVSWALFAQQLVLAEHALDNLNDSPVTVGATGTAVSVSGAMSIEAAFEALEVLNTEKADELTTLYNNVKDTQRGLYNNATWNRFQAALAVAAPIVAAPSSYYNIEIIDALDELDAAFDDLTEKTFKTLSITAPAQISNIKIDGEEFVNGTILEEFDTYSLTFDQEDGYEVKSVKAGDKHFLRLANGSFPIKLEGDMNVVITVGEAAAAYNQAVSNLPWADTAMVLLCSEEVEGLGGWANNFDWTGDYVEGTINNVARIDGNGEYTVSVILPREVTSIKFFGISLVFGTSTYNSSRIRFKSVKTYTDMEMQEGETELIKPESLTFTYEEGGTAYGKTSINGAGDTAWEAGKDNMRRFLGSQTWAATTADFDTTKLTGTNGNDKYFAGGPIKAVEITFYFQHNNNLATNNVSNLGELTALIDDIKDTAKDDYNNASWDAFQAQLTFAQAAALNENNAPRTITTGQTLVASGISVLQGSFDALEETDYDGEFSVTLLQELYDEYKDAKAGAYTAATWQPFNAALVKAQEILAAPGDFWNAEIEEAVINLDTGYAYLEFSDVPFDVVDNKAAANATISYTSGVTAGKAAAGTDITFTVAANTGFTGTATVTVTIDGEAYVPTLANGVYTIAGADVSGEVVITVGGYTALQYNITNNSASANAAITYTAGVTNGKATYGTAITFTVAPLSGYQGTATIAITIGGTAYTPTVESGVYTIAGGAIDGDIVVSVSGYTAAKAAKKGCKSTITDIGMTFFSVAALAVVLIVLRAKGKKSSS